LPPRGYSGLKWGAKSPTCGLLRQEKEKGAREETNGSGDRKRFLPFGKKTGERASGNLIGFGRRGSTGGGKVCTATCRRKWQPGKKKP